MDTAFFFQGDSILTPEHIPVDDIDMEIPFTLIGEFDILSKDDLTDQCEIPALSSSSPLQSSSAFLQSSTALNLQGEAPIRFIVIPPQVAVPSGWKALPVRQALSLLNGQRAQEKPPSGAGSPKPKSIGRLLRAFHIAQWRREARFCGSCGAKNGDSTVELAKVCPACGRLEYPRIAPAIIVIVTNDAGQVLLAHNKSFKPGIYSLIAGFNEAGENLEATVRRELKEETNIEVRDIRYQVSQPWPFPNSLMVGFSAHYAGGDLQADNVEIEDARWWDRDALPNLPGHGFVSRFLIDLWLEGKLDVISNSK